MLRTSNYLTTDFLPIYAVVEVFIYQSTYCDIVSSHKIKSMAYLRARLWVVRWSDDAFDCVVEYNVGYLIAREEGPYQSPPIHCDDKYLL